MSICEENKIDWMGATENGECLKLCIYDHLDWEDEYIHLLMLQDKINAYLAFLEDEQWKAYAPESFDFKYAMIEVQFLHEITENCEKYLQYAQDQVGQLGIKIRGIVTG